MMLFSKFILGLIVTCGSVDGARAQAIDNRAGAEAASGAATDAQAQSGSRMQKNVAPPTARRQPPAAARAACDGKTAGEVCSFASASKEVVTGACFQADATLPLACRRVQ